MRRAVYVCFACGAAALASTCDSRSDDGAGAVSLARFAHTSNTDYVQAAAKKSDRPFVPTTRPALVDAAACLRQLDLEGGKYLTYESQNGWNNQLLNLFMAVDMARLLNRTLIVPPFTHVVRRGDAQVSVGRLISLRRLAAIVPLIAEDEHGTVAAALSSAQAKVRGRAHTQRLEEVTLRTQTHTTRPHPAHLT
jgi:hypothetical protein